MKHAAVDFMAVMLSNLRCMVYVLVMFVCVYLGFPAGSRACAASCSRAAPFVHV